MSNVSKVVLKLMDNIRKKKLLTSLQLENTKKNGNILLVGNADAIEFGKTIYCFPRGTKCYPWKICLLTIIITLWPCRFLNDDV